MRGESIQRLGSVTSTRISVHAAPDGTVPRLAPKKKIAACDDRIDFQYRANASKNPAQPGRSCRARRHAAISRSNNNADGSLS